jgi:hypothetical protein
MMQAVMSEQRRLKLKRREHRKNKQEGKRRAAVTATFLRLPNQGAPAPSTDRMSGMLGQLATPLPNKVPEDSASNTVYSVKVLPLRDGEAVAGPLSEEQRATLDAEIEAKGEHFYITAASLRRSP